MEELVPRVEMRATEYALLAVKRICGFCEEVCPEEAIVMSDEYILTFASQEEAVFGKDKLLMPKERLQKRLDFLKQNM